MKNIHKLENGILFISHKLPKTNSVTINVAFKAGSIYEDKSNNGISHLVEHLFFRQLADIPQSELYYKTHCIGAELSGCTYSEYVLFSITVVPKFFYEAFSIITKTLMDFHWSEDVINAERKVVLKQIENSYDSYQKWVNSYYFENTKYNYLIMGEFDTVKSLSVEEVNSWKDKYFCSCNSCVSVVGNYSDCDFEKAEKLLKNIPEKGSDAKAPVCTPNNFCSRNSLNQYSFCNTEDNNLSEFVMFVDIPLEMDYETVRLICSIIGEGCGSIISKELRDNRGYTDDVFTELFSYNGFHRLSISFSVKDLDLLNSIECLFKSVNSFINDFKQKDYNDSIRFFTDNQIMDYDSTKTLSDNYILCDFVFDGSIISEPIEKQKKYSSISIERIKNTTKLLFKPENISFFVMSEIGYDIINNKCEEQLLLLS